MCSQNLHSNNIKTTDLTIGEITNNQRKKAITNLLQKIQSADIAQVKIYLGFAYFTALSILSFTLLF